MNQRGHDQETGAPSRTSAGRPSRHPADHVIILFGASGDLARRKLLPGLFHLSAAGLMPRHYRIIGSAPPSAALTDEQFRQRAKDAVTEFGTGKPDGEAWDAFERSLSFAGAEPSDTAGLADAVQRAEREIGGTPGRLFHLAIPPSAFAPTVTMIGKAGLADGGRVIIEKPFGNDLASAQELDRTVHAVFDETRVFRIDHFLGKESVENILALRFANGFMEPMWNRQYLAYVQIDVPETLGVEGRGSFYDQTGAYRDMIVTHLFQVLGFVAMDPPTAFDAKRLRDEKQRVFEALRPVDVRHVVRGQYEGYRDEPGVARDSGTETMAAVRAEIDNWRWTGVPFLLRSGKKLGESRQTITLGFRRPPMQMFPARARDIPAGLRDEMIIDFADPGSITAEFLAKVPGVEMTLGNASMVFRYDDSFQAANDLEGYERLILEAMLGDQIMFTRSDGIERLWEISAPLLEDPPPVEPYAPGSWGPEASVARLAAPFRWHLPQRRASRGTGAT